MAEEGNRWADQLARQREQKIGRLDGAQARSLAKEIKRSAPGVEATAEKRGLGYVVLVTDQEGKQLLVRSREEWRKLENER